MLNTAKLTIKNSITGVLSQTVSMIFLFITRNLFIKYIGIELLGLNGTFTSILQTLSLAELGFQTAIVHSMYKPLAGNNKRELNDILNAFKYIYRTIGFVFIAGTIIVCPFLDQIITGMKVTKIIYLYFLIQSLSSAASYFLAYKRSLLFADQKDYISKIVDMMMNIIACVLQLIAIVICHSYLLYITIKVFQVIVSNIIIGIECDKMYPYLKDNKVDKKLLKSLWKDVKSIFVGKIASYVYSSTDNLVISALIKTALVGVLSNYTAIVVNLKTLLNCLVAPIGPIIGKSIAEKKPQKEQYSLFQIYTHFRFVLALVIIVPIIVLMNTFISIWVGSDYVLNYSVVILICAEFYIHLVHSALCDYINGEGLFDQEKYISILAAMSNLGSSILLAIFIGLDGVLLGTVISQMIFWIGRSLIVSKYCFRSVSGALLKYWIEQLKYIFFFVIVTLLCEYVFSFVSIEYLVIRFLLGGVICEIVIFGMYLLVYGKSRNFNELLNMLNMIVKKGC